MDLSGWLALTTVSSLGLILVVVVAGKVGVRRQAVLCLAVHGAAATAIFLMAGVWTPDAMAYDENAAATAEYWAGGPRPSAVTAGKEGFPAVLGVVYFLFGHYPPLGLALNVIAGGLLVATLAGIAQRIGAPVRRTAYFAVAFPPIILWGGLLLREAFTWLLLSVFIYALIGVVKFPKIRRDWLLLFGALLILLWVRGTVAVLAGAAGLFALAVVRRDRKASVLTLVGLAAVTPYLYPRLDKIVGEYSLENANTVRSALARNADTAFPVVRFSDPLGLVQALPNIIPRVIAGPYPWEWRSLGVIFATDAIVWLLVLLLAWQGWRRSGDKRLLLLVVLPSLALLGALAVMSGNYGTMQRLRAQVAVIVLPIAALGTVRKGQQPLASASHTAALPYNRSESIGFTKTPRSVAIRLRPVAYTNASARARAEKS